MLILFTECSINAHKHCKDLVVMECRAKAHVSTHGRGSTSSTNGCNSPSSRDVTLATKRKMSLVGNLHSDQDPHISHLKSCPDPLVTKCSEPATHNLINKIPYPSNQEPISRRQRTNQESRTSNQEQCFNKWVPKASDQEFYHGSQRFKKIKSSSLSSGRSKISRRGR